ncbi:hypothetical protein [Streptomyces sp. CB03911]|uniref:hypothetical protein n=1 Tax=Streptomyces sp. CB03911 TaxID=1804758 RepID=UPI0018FE24B0|nr:hypothetical protein [Streptomyces sp. CB03911]
MTEPDLEWLERADVLFALPGSDGCWIAGPDLVLAECAAIDVVPFPLAQVLISAPFDAQSA